MNENRQQLTGSRSRALPRLFPAAMLLMLTAASGDPLIESLADRQARTYRLAAPSGIDSPTSDAVDLTVLAQPAVPRTPSVLATVAEASQAPVTLADRAQPQLTRSQLDQFGYHLFLDEPASRGALDGLPVPPGYRVGPGDTLIVQLWGSTNVEYRLTVTRDGRLLIPDLGPLNVSGMTFEDTRLAIVEGLAERVIGATATVAMGDLRTMQYRLTGDVVRPGLVTVSSLSTLLDALLNSQGVAYSGSLRKIELRRNHQTVTRLDLYDLLLRGDTRQDLPMQHQDVVFVPPIGDVVYVAGDVQRPAIYELLNERTVGDVLELAGGMLPTASLAHSHIERLEQARFRTLIDLDQPDALDTPVRNGDLIRILPADDVMDGVVMVSGHAQRPGGYQHRAAMRVTDAIPDYSALLPGVDLAYGLIVRENADRTIEVLDFNPARAIAAPGADADPPLQPRDELMVFAAGADRAGKLASVIGRLRQQSVPHEPGDIVEVRGWVRLPGAQPLTDGARLSTALRGAGGVKPGIDAGYVIIERQREGRVQILRAALTVNHDDPRLHPGDRIYLFGRDTMRPELLAAATDRLQRQARHGAPAPIILARGLVRFPGLYPLHEGMTVQDLICAAGGLERSAFAVNAQLSRSSETAASRGAMTHQVIELGHLDHQCEAPSQVEPADSPTLIAGDQLTLVEKPGWSSFAAVELHGEVTRPGVYPIDRGETLCEVLERAGGLTPDAYAFGARFTRRSVRALQQQTLDAIQDQLDDLMIELSLSHSARNDEKTPAGPSKSEYLAVIRQLERAEASGRMVIDLDRIAACDNEADIVLEDGDALHVPLEPNYVNVAGQVYVPTAHRYAADRDAGDYIELSGGATVLGRLRDTYVIQANGEVVGYRDRRTSRRVLRRSVSPGAQVLVPLNVDRMNTTERIQSWTRSLFEAAVFAGIVL